MMSFKFTKMHGLGNDFVVIDAVRQNIFVTPELIRSLADRQEGVGCDQVLMLTPAEDVCADFGYRIFNADGSEAYQCGNGARCMGLFIKRFGLSDKKNICLQTRRDFLTVSCCDNDEVQVDIARPHFDPQQVPMLTDEHVAPYHLQLRDHLIEYYVVNVGNPHCVLRVDAISIDKITDIGKQLNAHPAFPEGVNVGMMVCESRDSIELCVYERGAGLTRACGSGACAAVAVGRQQGWLDAVVRVRQPGGVLLVSWPSSDKMIQLRGPAVYVFDGVWKNQ